jgi:hypothetical protein
MLQEFTKMVSLCVMLVGYKDPFSAARYIGTMNTQA